MANNKLPTNKDVAKLLKISRVHNTDKCMAKWLRAIDRYREASNYEKSFESISKAESIHNCYASLARYLKEHSTIKPCNIWDSYKFGKALRILDGKMKKLQKKGLGETDQSAAFTVDEIFQILDHESISGNDNESLVRRVFFWLSLLCGLRGGDTAKLKVSDISRQPHGGLFLVLMHEKNNQCGALKRNKYGKSAARKLPIPPDNSNNCFKPVYDILKMISLHSLNADDALFLETCRAKKGISMGEKKLGTMMSQIADLTKINLDNGRKITNHSLRRTAIQRLKDLNIPEDERMEFSGHRSREGIKAYNNSNEDQKIQNTALLIPLDYEDLPYEEFNYFPGNGINYLNFEDNPEIYDDSSNSSSILPSARSNYDKRSTFRSRIPRLSSHRSPLKSVSNQAAPYYIPTFHDIKKLHESSFDSNNKQEIHYHFHYHL
ncbi:20574_t:CDS:2 [Cetraspora pellucida]|uniref:20574_t:CDS:1 n=1 Tax=Cetraspora pellucida TaxID=1433469 RepID=A0A9N9FBY5_9GLOM|nr:20574_t:CDS:2 [Cetraspora pellucida]